MNTSLIKFGLCTSALSQSKVSWNIFYHLFQFTVTHHHRQVKYDEGLLKMQVLSSDLLRVCSGFTSKVNDYGHKTSVSLPVCWKSSHWIKQVIRQAAQRRNPAFLVSLAFSHAHSDHSNSSSSLYVLLRTVKLQCSLFPYTPSSCLSTSPEQDSGTGQDLLCLHATSVLPSCLVCICCHAHTTSSFPL